MARKWVAVVVLVALKSVKKIDETELKVVHGETNVGNLSGAEVDRKKAHKLNKT